MSRPLALGAYYPRYDCYVTALILLHGRWDLVTPELGEPMRTPHGPEVGDVMRGTAEPCGCLWDAGRWFACPDHQASCKAVVLWQDSTRTEPVQRCGVPIEAGDLMCASHQHRLADCPGCGAVWDGRQREGTRCAACQTQAAEV